MSQQPAYIAEKARDNLMISANYRQAAQANQMAAEALARGQQWLFACTVMVFLIVVVLLIVIFQVT